MQRVSQTLVEIQIMESELKQAKEKYKTSRDGGTNLMPEHHSRENRII